MKKILSIILISVIMLGALGLFGCSKKPEELKIGVGIYTNYETIKSADGDALGKAQILTTAAAVLINAEGIIVDCVFDSVDVSGTFDAEGKANKLSDIKTKRELGTSYGMSAASSVGKEWFEQADIFAGLVKGKTIEGARELVAEDNTASDAVISAGCTMAVAPFKLALENAVKNVKASTATANDSLGLSIVTTHTTKDADGDALGNTKFDFSVSAVAKSADGKITACISDAIDAKATFDENGVTETKADAQFTSKRQAGDGYGMKSASSIQKEWFEQADAFDAACVGKTAGEIAGLESNGYANEPLKASCSIAISDMVKAVAKAAQ